MPAPGCGMPGGRSGGAQGAPKCWGPRGPRGTSRRSPAPIQRRGIGVHAGSTRLPRGGSGHAGPLPTRPLLVCVVPRVAFLLEANFDKFTQRKHTLREDGEGLAASCFLNPEPELNQEAG